LLFGFQILIYQVGAYHSLQREKLWFLYAFITQGQVKKCTCIRLSKHQTEDKILHHHHAENKFQNN